MIIKNSESAEYKISTHDDIFKTLNSIEKKYNNLNVIPIVINNDVPFVHPFFITLLFQYQNRTKKNLVLDFINAKFNVQHHMHTFLQQYKHLKIITLHHPGKYENVIFEKPIHKRPEEYIRTVIRKDNAEGDIHFYYTKFHKDNIGFCSGSYNFLPLLRLTNLTDVYDYNELVYIDDIPKKCMNFYKNISIDLNEKNYGVELSDGIENIINGIVKDIEDNVKKNNKHIKLQDRQFLENLKELKRDINDIFFELIDNIHKHTEIKGIFSNAYLSSRTIDKKNIKNSKYEFIISDDFEDGLIKSFGKTLENDLNNLPDRYSEVEDINDSYSTGISKIKLSRESEDIEILNGLFGLDTSFGLREIQRLTVHFGIPTLMRLLGRLKGNLNIYVHHDKRYYHISFNGGVGTKPIIKPLKEKEEFYGVQGTHIVITFPYQGLEEYLNRSYRGYISQKLDLKNEKLQIILDNRDKIQKRINDFHYILPETLKEDIFKGGDEKYIIVKYVEGYYGTVSDFFRNLYAFALFYDTRDIYVYDFPIDLHENHVAIVVETVVPIEANPNIMLPNIILQDALSFDMTFIGGKDRSSQKKIDNLISKYYNQKEKNLTDNSISLEDSRKGDIDIASHMFYKIYPSDPHILLPFTIFRNEKMSSYLLGFIIQKYLRSNALDLHIDTGQGYHINQFFQFKSIYEDSQWANRIAFVLAVDILNILKKETTKLVLVGTDKYARLILSLCKTFLEKRKILKEGEKPIKVEKLIIDKDSLFETKKLKDFIANKYEYIIYSPVLFHGEAIEKNIINKYDSKSLIRWFSSIKIDIKGQNDRTDNAKYPLATIELIEDSNVFEANHQKPCPVCSGGVDEKPLFKLSTTDSFSIENTYVDNYEEKKFSALNRVKINKLKWYDSVHFGHTERGLNHYTYYTKTKTFFNSNNLKLKIKEQGKKEEVQPISDWLEKKVQIATDNRRVVIIAPLNSTNNSFVTLVDEVVFKNDATIYRFDKSKAEMNFYSLDSVNIGKDDLVYFVDDEISSSNTTGYFYSLLRAKCPTKSFDGAIFMIDRTSAYDERILCNYIGCKSNKQDKEVCFEERLKNVYTFTKLEIRPIKTEMERCFFCDRQRQYIKMFDDVALDMNRYQLAKRIAWLNLEDYKEIDNEEDKDFENNIKAYIKMYAIDYVYSHFDKFSKLSEEEDILKGYIELESKFKEEIYNVLIKPFMQQENYDDNSVIRQILDYESEIALHKALAYPKLVYYVSIRKVITLVMIYKIKNHITNKTSGITTPLFNKDDVLQYTEAIKSYMQSVKNKKLLESIGLFVGDYMDRCMIDRLNTLYVTAAHININYILNFENIAYYYRAIEEVKSQKKLSNELLHAYPFAVKLVCSQGEDRAAYFEKQLDVFYKKVLLEPNPSINHRASLINALRIENNYLVQKKIVCTKSGDSKEDFSECSKRLIKSFELDIEQRINEFIEYIKRVVENNFNKDFSIKHIFINENLHYNYENYNYNYRRYLEMSSLRDIIHNFKKIDLNSEKGIQILYEGHQKDHKDIIEKKQINNMWSNRFVDFLKNKKYTIVRLIDIDADTLKTVKNNSITFLRRNTNVKADRRIDWYIHYKPYPKEVNFKKIKNSLRFNLPKVWTKPIGCIVISHDDDDYLDHLAITRILLSVQSDIVRFAKSIFLNGNAKDTIKKVEYDAMHKSFIHNEGSMLEMAPLIEHIEKGCSVFKKNDIHSYLQMFRQYAHGVTKIGRIGRLKLEDYSTIKDTDIFNLIDNEKDRIYGFIEMTYGRGLLNSKIDINLNSNVKGFLIPINYATLSTIVYELFYNAAKYGMGNPVVVEVYANNSILYIKNKNKINTRKGFGIAIDNITEVFSKVNYRFSAKPIEKEYIITIEEDK